ncbi:riboflavin synthase subunit alpha [Allohahella marinimesophila]|uniref:Riboflavin synthase n=1 Tax=Allohahella marinimesophila TaxID=1054972 RepID=A0ABP7Q958_9GAMM
MFTGIVQGKARIRSIEKLEGLWRLQVVFPSDQSATSCGASVAVNGACLTVTAINSAELAFDVMQETLRITTLGQLNEGDWVNFEHAARIGDEIGGHLLSGHVHGVATVAAVTNTPNNTNIAFTVPEPLRAYIFHKGYIGVNGASLTVGHLTPDGFSVDLIPETLRMTTFGELADAADASQRAEVNLEIDSQTQVIVDTVERILRQKAGLG